MCTRAIYINYKCILTTAEIAWKSKITYLLPWLLSQHQSSPTNHYNSLAPNRLAFKWILHRSLWTPSSSDYITLSYIIMLVTLILNSWWCCSQGSSGWDMLVNSCLKWRSYCMVYLLWCMLWVWQVVVVVPCQPITNSTTSALTTDTLNPPTINIESEHKTEVIRTHLSYVHMSCNLYQLHWSHDQHIATHHVSSFYL